MCRSTFRSYLPFAAVGRCVEIKRCAHDLQFRVLIMHCRPHVSMAHGAHDRREISCARQDACSIVVPRTVQHQFLLLALPHFGPAETSCRSISGDQMQIVWKETPNPRTLYRSASSEWHERVGSLARAFALLESCCPGRKSSGYSNPS